MSQIHEENDNTDIMETQIRLCQEMYAKLHLDKPPMTSSPFPLLRGRTTMERPSRPLTYTLRSNYTSQSRHRPVSFHSTPGYMVSEEEYQTFEKTEERLAEGKAEDLISEDTDNDCDRNQYGRKRGRMDTSQLSEYLESHGFGLPNIVKPNNVYRRPSQSLPRGYKNRTMPRNPSQREKIKGRARLDQEMANMKALAFCEQQAPRIFRTASANIKNRDVQLMEEEMRENIHREVLDLDLENGGIDDDNASIVMMPITHEELEIRINTWMAEVENACKSHTCHAGHPA